MTSRSVRVLTVVIIVVLGVTLLVGGAMTISEAQTAVADRSFLPGVWTAIETPTPIVTNPSPGTTPSPTPNATNDPNVTLTPTPTNTPSPNPSQTPVPNGTPQLTRFSGTTNQDLPVELDVTLLYERLLYFEFEAQINCGGTIYTEEVTLYSVAGIPIKDRAFEFTLPFKPLRPEDKKDRYTGTFDEAWTTVEGTWKTWAVEDDGEIICANDGTWSATRQ